MRGFLTPPVSPHNDPPRGRDHFKLTVQMPMGSQNCKEKCVPCKLTPPTEGIQPSYALGSQELAAPTLYSVRVRPDLRQGALRLSFPELGGSPP